MLIFNIATVARRQKSFATVLASMLQQTRRCDVLNIACPPDVVNVVRDPPMFTNVSDLLTQFPQVNITVGTFTAAAKMWNVDAAPDDSEFLTFDDDIDYPPDYAAQLVGRLRRDPSGVVGYHGIWWDPFPVQHYYHRKLYQYFDIVPDNYRVHVIGTGCCGFHTQTLRAAGFSYQWFSRFPPEHGNVNDMLFAQFCRLHHIPMTVAAHPKGWLRILDGTQDKEALWKLSAKDKHVELRYLQEGPL